MDENEQIEKCDSELKPGDIFTVRGHGKFIFDGVDGNFDCLLTKTDIVHHSALRYSDRSEFFNLQVKE